MKEQEYINELKLMLSDDDGSKNILNRKMPQYNYNQYRFFIRRALADMNSGTPPTNYSLEEFPDPDLVLMGGLIFACITEGILQLRNQVDYNDAGLSVSLFNKTGGYQGWAGMLLQGYTQDKQAFKNRILPSSPGAGFYGIRSQFSSDWGAGTW